MRTHAEQAIRNYANAYQKLYRQPPLEFRTLDGNRVVIDGVPVHVTELEHLTIRLESEYREIMARKRSVIERLIAWCKQ